MSGSERGGGRTAPTLHRFLLIAAATAGLAGCAADQGGPESAAPPPRAEEAAAAPRRAAPSLRPGEDLSLLAPPPGSVDGFYLPPLRRPADLEGLDRAELAAAFGPPTFRRRDMAAEVWQYAARRCMLDVFLYRNGAGLYRAAHAEVRGRGPFRPDPDRCLDALRVNP